MTSRRVLQMTSQIWSTASARQKYHSTKMAESSFEGHVVVDLRSDTLTLPTLEMRRAMADAVVGDDVFGEDPTIDSKSFISFCFC